MGCAGVPALSLKRPQWTQDGEKAVRVLRTLHMHIFRKSEVILGLALFDWTRCLLQGVRHGHRPDRPPVRLQRLQ